MASQWAVGAPVTAKVYPSDLTRLQIVAPEGFTYRPGQHVYLRVPKVSMFDNHPFTIRCSFHARVHAPEKSPHQPGHSQDPFSFLLFVTSHNGFTRQLMRHLESKPEEQLEAWIEGPYGGHDSDLTVEHDSVVLVAGGTGISACLPWLEYFAHHFRTADTPGLRTSYVRLVWSIREAGAISWIEDALRSLDLSSLPRKIAIEIHVTGDAPPKKDSLVDKVSTQAEQAHFKDAVTATESKRDSLEVGLDVDIKAGRINMDDICTDLPYGSRAIILGSSQHRLGSKSHC